MSNQTLRTTVLAAALIALAAPARAGKIGSRLTIRAAPRSVPAETAPVPLRLAYTLERRLPLAMRLDVTPELVVARDEQHVGAVLGCGGTVAINAWGDLLVVTGRIASRDGGDGSGAAWSVGVTLGDELALPGKAIARHILSRARSVLSLVL